MNMTGQNLLEILLNESDDTERVFIRTAALRAGLMWVCCDCGADNILPDVECLLCGSGSSFDVQDCMCGEVRVALTGQGSKCDMRRPFHLMVRATYVPIYLQETARASGSWDGVATETTISRRCAADFEGDPFVHIEH